MQRDVPIQRLLVPAAVLLLSLAVGTAGYMLIEGWTFADALYMTVTSVTAVGYGEINPLSATGRVFTMVLLFIGVGSIYYFIGTSVGLIFEGQINRHWERRRMERRVETVRDHYIICGFGRVGQQVAHTLVKQGQPVVVIDQDPLAIQRFEPGNILLVEGNATEDAALRRAGIERAGGLITAVATDADNVFVTLSARALRPDLPIVARANHDDAIPKLRRAGATQVVSPYAMAGQQMAFLAAKPATVNFVETLLRGVDADLVLEEVHVAPGSALIGVQLSDARRRFAKGAVFLAVQRGGRVMAPPPIELDLTAGDVVAVVGTGEQLQSFEEACQSAAPVVSPVLSPA